MTNRLPLHAAVRIKRDLFSMKLKAGETGKIVECHPGGVAYEVEVLEDDGVTPAVVTLLGEYIEAV